MESEGDLAWSECLTSTGNERAALVDRAARPETYFLFFLLT